MPVVFSLFLGLLVSTVPLAEAPVSFQQVMERSTATADEIIRYGDAEPQFIELYLPADANANTPLVVYLHGGCWQNSFSVDHARGFADGVRADGFAVALVEYRRLGDEGGGWPGTMDDIIRAIETLAEQSEPSYLSQSFALIGHSAGGHLALLASQPQRRLPIRGVLGLAAITDLEAYAEGESGCQQAGARFIATAASEVDAMNPVKQPQHSLVFLLRGDQDTIVGEEQQQFDGARIIDIPGSGHFDVIHPDTEAFAQVLATLRSLYPEFTR